MTLRHLASALALLALVSACAPQDSTERVPADAPGYVNGKAVHPTIKIGKAYRVGDEMYRPKYEPTYSEVGTASWYGPDFHGKSTANGERYNQWAMTAAHRTLPMPSMVKVTNTKNGKSIMVRVNDRGPFSDNRIIDLSRAAAEELDMIGAGTAKVKVEYMKEETEQYIAKLKLDKPSEWTQTDIEMAQLETLNEKKALLDERAGKSRGVPDSGEFAVAVSDLKPLEGASPSSSPPLHHPVERADDVPRHFAFNAPFKSSSTVEQRGVDVVEVGYVDDAFSVLNDGQAPAPRRIDAPPDRAVRPAGKLYSFGASDPPDKPTGFAPPPSSSSRTVSYTAEKSDRKLDEIARHPFGGAPPAPAPNSNTVAFERYYVQAGSFASRENAQRLADKVSSLATVDVSEWPTGDKMLYRVRLGPTPHESAAEELMERLKAFGIADARLVTER